MATSPEDATAAERFRVALDLYATGEAMMRQRICREHPELSSSEVEDRLCAWLQTRPGAERGDAVGRSVPWPRPK